MICAAFVNFFLSASPHLSEVDEYIPSHNYISEIFNWVRSPFEVPELQAGMDVGSKVRGAVNIWY